MGREAEGLEEQLKKLSTWISESQRIVFFGGAGVSTESGIPDFRSSDGLYAEKRRYPPEQIVSHSFFLSHTEQFYEFYKERMLYPEAAPNAAHLALAELERQGKLSAVITQNIDGLHEKAGSKKVIRFTARCFETTVSAAGSSTICGICSRGRERFRTATAAGLSSRMWCSMRRRSIQGF